MTDILEFFNMGGYALYVWGSYGLTAVVLLVNYLLPMRREQRLMRKLSNLQGGKTR